MLPPLLLPLALLAAAALAYWLWTRFTRWEVAQNAALIAANGSQDNLRKGYHQRRGWVRFWPWLGLSVGAALPSLLLGGGWGVGLLTFAAVGLLLFGYFARFFTPLLNLARGLPEFQASGDSASWPDAKIWKQLRAKRVEPSRLWPLDAWQNEANEMLRQLLVRTWLYCRLAAGALGLAIIYTILR